MEGRSVRVLGIVDSILDPPDGRHLIIRHRKVRLEVDASHLSDVTLAVGSLFIFIGEIIACRDNSDVGTTADDCAPPSHTAPKMVLLARMARDFRGLDVDMYQKSVELRRDFLAIQLQLLQGQSGHSA
eukprot:jgi/Mesvir1/17956/Mv13002-RA.1